MEHEIIVAYLINLLIDLPNFSSHILKCLRLVIFFMAEEEFPTSEINNHFDHELVFIERILTSKIVTVNK